MPKTKKVVQVDSNLNPLFDKWNKAKQELDRAKAKELMLREQILAALWGDPDKRPKRGSFHFAWSGQGTTLDESQQHQLTLARYVSYKVLNHDDLEEMISTYVVPEGVFVREYKVRGGNFEAMDSKLQLRFEPLVSAQSGSFSFKDETV